MPAGGGAMQVARRDGGSCAAGRFWQVLDQRMAVNGDFAEVCQEPAWRGLRRPGSVNRSGVSSMNRVVTWPSRNVGFVISLMRN